MAIPTVYAPVKAQDFTLRPFTVHRKFTLSSTDLVNTGSGYSIVDGLYSGIITPIGSPTAGNDPTNSFDGSYKHVIWKSIDHMYYRHPYDSYATFEHANKRYTFKFLNYSASILNIPYMDYGESIKPGSIQFTSSLGFKFRDDGNGNLYDPSINTGSFTKNYNLIGYWSFNNEFRRFDYTDGEVIEHGTVGYKSYTFEPDEPSGIRNIRFSRGIGTWNDLDNTNGITAQFNGESYIITHDRPEFNPDDSEGFSLSFWFYASSTQSMVDTHYNTLISKRGVIRKNVYGVNEKYNQNNVLVSTKFVSSSVEDYTTDIFPFDIEIANMTHPSVPGWIRVRRSDGIRTSEIWNNQNIFDEYHHVLVTMDSTTMTLYVDGTIMGSAPSLGMNDVRNNNSIMFGALNRNLDQALVGKLGEIRMYNTAYYDDDIISTLCSHLTPSMFQTAVVGNVFYRRGTVVVSPQYTGHNRGYIGAFTSGSWSLNYRGTHTIYQYEALCRVKKGSFNLTYNPTARKSFKSDLLSDDMTGSLLLPYATTIGLYSSDGDLVAVGKLGQAVQMRDDVDLNFLVRWDT